MNISCPEGFSCKLGFKQLYDSCKIIFCKAQEIHRAEIRLTPVEVGSLSHFFLGFHTSWVVSRWISANQPATSPLGPTWLMLSASSSPLCWATCETSWKSCSVSTGSCWDSLRCYRSAVNKTKQPQIMRTQLNIADIDHPIATICDLEKKYYTFLNTSWWFQTTWKIFLKLDHFPG